MNSSNKRTGSYGESIAASYLQSKGFYIHEKNSTSRWGEIDIVAEKNRIIHFIEVKTRKATRQGRPVEAVTQQKLMKLKRAIDFYIKAHGFFDRKLSIDVIGIQLGDTNQILELKYYQNVYTDLFL